MTAPPDDPRLHAAKENMNENESDVANCQEKISWTGNANCETEQTNSPVRTSHPTKVDDESGNDYDSGRDARETPEGGNERESPSETKTLEETTLRFMMKKKSMKQELSPKANNTHHEHVRHLILKQKRKDATMTSPASV